MKNINARVANKRDTAANWALVETTFTPAQGEIIVYTETNSTHSKIKVGDGKHCLGELAFVQVKVAQALGKSKEDTMSQEAITTAIRNISHDIDSLLEGLTLDGGTAPPRTSAVMPILDGGDSGPQRPNNDPVPDPIDANEMRW